ncbi:MAG: uracil-DNA glycosylase [Proteobacteria bacterium]|nr:uracil-DNA glycosylase [Pseudomonadota bacterium]
MGDRKARICFFGRDPGRHEVQHQFPFVGAGGQKIRRVLHEVLHQTELPDFEASIAVGLYAYWANTVPYKPKRNKAWPKKVQRQVFPYIADLLINSWEGRDVITLGQLAFLWFGLEDRETLRALQAHWKRKDRFETSISATLTTPDGTSATFNIHPIPHPSPLNATWAPYFPGLLETRLRKLNFGQETWRL